MQEEINMHLEIKQTKLAPETVDSAVINKLYDLYHNRQSGDTFDLQGYIKTGAIFRNVETELETAFQDLEIEPDSYYIVFEDSEVENVIKTALHKAEGEGITTQEAAATNLGTIFKNNVDIESFDEFKYFMSPTKTLSKEAFYHCSSLERLDLSNCRSYPDDAFNGLTNLEYTGGAGSPQGVITIPEGTTSIGGWGNFIGCNKITSVILPDSLTYIQGNNFQKMAALTDITVGTGMAIWVRGNFSNCPNFNKVNIKDLDAWLNITFESTGDAETPLAVARHLYLNGTEVTSVDFTGKTMIKDKVLWGCLGLTSVVLPNTITSIGNSAFRWCENLVISDLNLPNLTILGSYAFTGTKLQAISSLGNIVSLSQGCFYNCTQLVNAVIPSTSTIVPKECFKNCLALTSVDLPSSVTTIERDAFSDCRNLATIDLTNITSLGEESFARCGSLSRFNGPNSTIGEIYLPNLTGNMDGVFRNLSQYAAAQIVYNITSLGTITGIGSWCFSIMRIETIHLPSTLKKISSNAFMNSPYVHDIYWEGTMDQWVNIDFGGEGSNPCSRSSVNFYVNGTTPTSYSFPDGTTTIKKYVFNGVKGLTSVTIPDGVTTIDENAFNGCRDLTSITIPNTVTEIKTFAFASTGFTSVTVPSGVTTIGVSAWRQCNSLASVTISDTVTFIGTCAFCDCPLRTVVIGSGVQTIDLNVFGPNTALTSLTCKAVLPPKLNRYDSIPQGTTYPIYVPADSVDAYKAANIWSTHASQIRAIQPI